jgi:hypothetical protein
VLGHDPARGWVFHRHVPTVELNHFRAHLAMHRIKGGLADGWSGFNCGQWALDLKQWLGCCNGETNYPNMRSAAASTELIQGRGVLISSGFLRVLREIFGDLGSAALWPARWEGGTPSGQGNGPALRPYRLPTEPSMPPRPALEFAYGHRHKDQVSVHAVRHDRRKVRLRKVLLLLPGTDRRPPVQ